MVCIYYINSSFFTAFFKKKNGKLVSKKCEEILEKAYLIRKGGAKRTAKSRKNKESVTRQSRVGNGPTLHNNTEHNITDNNSEKDSVLKIGDGEIGSLKTSTYEQVQELAGGWNINELERKWRDWSKDIPNVQPDGLFVAFVKTHIRYNKI